MTLALPKHLFHYSKRHIKKLQPRRYLYDPYRSSKKPEGLWISVEGLKDDINWFDYCKDVDCNLSSLKYKHQITLHPEANIPYISNALQFEAFEHEFMTVNSQISHSEEDGIRKFRTHTPILQEYTIDWFKVVRNFPGIIIAPYLWERRSSNRSNWCSHWYYGWDCASGCIWDLRCIQSFEMIEKMKLPRKKKEKKK